MPAARPRASFEPIPPDFDVRTFVETADNFKYADRITYEMIANNGMEQFEKLVLLHVIIGGKPLVIEGFEEVLDPWTFTPSWLRDNCGDKVENARNLTTKENIPLTIKHYLKHMAKLTEQFFDTPERYRDKTRQRIYLKDIDCPPVWQDKLKELIPAGLYYLNDNTGEMGGPGALDEPGFRKGRGIARAGDLMSSLPPEMRAENLMCYIGHEGTYTPSHREMCASLGQNIMVNASGTISEDGQPERPGSSLWFMTETKDRQVVSEYWLSVLGHDIEVENHFAQLIAWKKARFTTYVVEQRPGDFILIPPLAPHQVWNRGTRTMKIAWNRTTVETLEHALNEALPNSRIVCRDEQYKNKTIIYYTLLKYANLLRIARAQVELGGEQAESIQTSVKVRQVQRDFKKLFDLYKSVLLSEMFTPDSREHPEFLPYDSNVTCAYCRCNIFNRFLTCKTCKNAFSKDIDEPYDVCMDCYCMGRSCQCQSGYQWVEQWKWKDLVRKYEEWRAQIIDIDGQMTESTPLPLQEERRYLGKKTLAQVCQEQLKLRPFVDPNVPVPVDDGSDGEEIIVNDDGTVKKTVKKKSKQWLRNNKSCHCCLHRHPTWKMAFCSNCDLGYCYGTLFRAHDMMPLVVMENPSWKCPHCKRTCNTGACRRDPRQHPYEPKGTLLGHDTKKVADPRSVECLVDFSVSNLNWLREGESIGNSTGPMQRRVEEAERAKMVDPALDDRYTDDDHDHSYRNGIAYSPVVDGTAEVNGFIDPSAVQFQPDMDFQDDTNHYYYPDPYMNGDIPRLGKRTHEYSDLELETPKRKKPKKQKKDEPVQPLPPKNASGKQYQKEVQKKLLEEAKKDDRFIIVYARMRQKSKIVKLSLTTGLLDTIRQRSTLVHRSEPRLDEQREEQNTIGSILESDVLNPKAVSPTNGEAKTQKSFRIRVDEDQSYGTRRRDREGGATGKSSRPPARYEEVTIDSEEDVDEDDYVEYTGNRNGRSQGRSSAWLARKNQGEEDMPTELPSNFKDGDVNPRRERDRERDQERRERRKTMPSNSKAGIRKPGRPSRKSTGDVSDHEEDAPHVEDTDAFSLAQTAAAAATAIGDADEALGRDEEAKAREEAAAVEAEANMRAKMAIWGDGSEDEEVNNIIDTLAAEDERLHEERDNQATPETPPVSVRTGPPQTSNSIFLRPGMAGKKIKITAAKRNGTTAGPSATSLTSPISTSDPKPVRKKDPKAVDLSEESESDSEDEIPATAPEPKRPTRPVGRPTMRPTRGSSMAKRGRGRPRKVV
ncbi:hypothetical protein BU24DRAFT_442739 [Aaosphaeria arxii CBS 175.79]|uniref:JmjC domain-containing protein n=1 Tax=Aaosphaeria arxii CBS 175.79 TaxID=1450172 RepID=A0A6A5XN76_9PLEO|nr:uncharacterized protein BU24DRAFT_442739 [Aaosphaeria arxii CBS 175.79]KAF2013804.1 hypothetical protein BU24DRAFT_442739 [Aaosphaeria arxii CBS 175.79]